MNMVVVTAIIGHLRIMWNELVGKPKTAQMDHNLRDLPLLWYDRLVITSHWQCHFSRLGWFCFSDGFYTHWWWLASCNESFLMLLPEHEDKASVQNVETFRIITNHRQWTVSTISVILITYSLHSMQKQWTLQKFKVRFLCKILKINLLFPMADWMCLWEDE